MHRELRKFTFIFRCNTHLFTRLSRVTARYHSIITVVCITVCKPRFENLFVGISDSVWIIFYHLLAQLLVNVVSLAQFQVDDHWGNPPLCSPLLTPHHHSLPHIPIDLRCHQWCEQKMQSIWKSHAVRNTNKQILGIATVSRFWPWINGVCGDGLDDIDILGGSHRRRFVT